MQRALWGGGSTGVMSWERDAVIVVAPHTYKRRDRAKCACWLVCALAVAAWLPRVPARTVPSIDQFGQPVTTSAGDVAVNRFDQPGRYRSPLSPSSPSSRTPPALPAPLERLQPPSALHDGDTASTSRRSNLTPLPAVIDMAAGDDDPLLPHDIGTSGSGGCQLPADFGDGVDRNLGRSLTNGIDDFCVAGEILYHNKRCYVRCSERYIRSDGGTDFFECTKVAHDHHHPPRGPVVTLTPSTMNCTEQYCKLGREENGHCKTNVSLIDGKNVTLAKLNSGWSVFSESQAGGGIVDTFVCCLVCLLGSGVQVSTR